MSELRVIERRRWAEGYDSEYINDESLEHEVQQLAMAPFLIANKVENRPGAFIEKYGHHFRLSEMKSKHFQTGKYSSKRWR